MSELTQDFRSKLFKFIADAEGFRGYIYSDINGYPTVGYGHNLFADGIDYPTDITQDFIDAQVPIPSNEVVTFLLDRENGYLSDTNYIALQQSGLTSEQREAYSNNLTILLQARCSSYSITKTQARALFDHDAEEAWDGLEASLEGALAGLSNNYINTDAGVALVSLAFNNPALIGTNLLNALKFDNKIAAWYEIAYYTNGDNLQGIANRRYAEAHKFLDLSSLTAEEAQDLAQFLVSDQVRIGDSGTYIRNVRDKILAYQNQYSPRHTDCPVKNEFPLYIEAGTNKISISIQDADYEVISATEVKITGNGNSNKLFGSSWHDTILGNGGNDTIYGDLESIITSHDGNDSLDGGSGNDTIYGGGGNDTLIGGANNDFLHGDTGNDLLQGGKGNDKLYGGVGNDTYVFEKGDGQDVIIDSDGKGKIVIKNPGKKDITLYGTTDLPYEEGKWRDKNGVIYQWSGNDLVTAA